MMMLMIMKVVDEDNGGAVAPMTTTPAAPMNPCAAVSGTSWVQLPYPGDPSRFIICYDSTRYDVYRCSAGLVWMRDRQMCGRGGGGGGMVETTTLPPPATPTTPAAAAGGSGMTPLCWSGSSLSIYHAYPADITRFLQCDSSGHVFVLSCGPAKVWHNGYKTCVSGGDSAMTSAQQQGQGQGQGQWQSQQSTGQGGKWTQNSMLTSTQQGQGQGGKWQWGMTGAAQQQGQVGNGQGQNGQGQADAAAEIFRIICPVNYEYDVRRGRCDAAGGRWNAGAGATSSACPRGFSWSVELYVCIRRIKTTADANGAKDGDSSSTGGGGGQTSVAGGGGNATVPMLSEADNPCLPGAGFYFPFPNNSAFFVQCDLVGNAFVQSCAAGLEWNQNLLTCAGAAFDDPDASSDGDGGDDGQMTNGVNDTAAGCL